MGSKSAILRLGITALVAAVASSVAIFLGGGQGHALAHPKEEASYTPVAGSWGTDELVQRAADHAAGGWKPERINREVYAPFIVAGSATFTDTWGAPRSGPAPGQVRTHEGQDVFCEYGAPVLAPEAGTLSMSNGGLGGLTSRVHRPDGGYWYLTHLSAFNPKLSNGDTVAVGDVIGYCGNSGNAATTSAHVHFGWYSASGEAMNPLDSLITWLGIAEGRSYEQAAAATRAQTGKRSRGNTKSEGQQMAEGTQGTLTLAIQPADRGKANKSTKPPSKAKTNR